MSREGKDRPTRQERKKARAELAALLRRLRTWCETLDQIGEWHKIASEIEEVLDTHTDAIPLEKRRRIRQAMDLSEITMDSVSQACKVLQIELASAIPKPVPPTVGTLVNVALIIVAVSVAVVTATANLTAVDVRVHNYGCHPLYDPSQASIADSFLPTLAGIKLPKEPIEDGEHKPISLPSVTVQVDNVTDSDVLVLSAFGLNLSRIPVGDATDVHFNEQPLLGELKEIDLGRLNGRSEHKLEIHCGIR